MEDAGHMDKKYDGLAGIDSHGINGKNLFFSQKKNKKRFWPFSSVLLFFLESWLVQH
uniref:Uncharacterized protein n=1 Tax=Rhizophora mucronata TaxID=61149 RepID=A0A2P2QJS0_RHIMU